MAKELKLSRNTEACVAEILIETTTLISSCYGFETNNMADCVIQSF